MVRYQKLNLWRVKASLQANKYCSLASTCEVERAQFLGLPNAAEAQAKARSALSTNLQDEIHPFLGDPDLLLNDVTSARYLIQGLRWGSHSAQDVAALPDGFIVFCIPLEGTSHKISEYTGSDLALGCGFRLPAPCICWLTPCFVVELEVNKDRCSFESIQGALHIGVRIR